MNKSQHREVLLASIILAVLVFAFFSIDTLRSYRTEVSIAETATKNLSHVLEMHLSEMFSKVDYRLKDIAKHYDKISRFDPERRKRAEGYVITHLKDIRVDDSNEIRDVVVLDKNRKLIENFGESKGPFHLRQDFIDQMMADETTDNLYFSQPYKIEDRNRWYFQMARKYTDKKNRVAGFVIATVRLHYFREYFQKLNLGNKGNVTLSQTESLMMLARHPWIEDKIGKPVRTTRSLNPQGLKQIAFSESSIIDGVYRFYNSRVVSSIPFTITVGLARSEVLAAWLQRTLFNAVLILSAFVGFGIFLIRYLEAQENLDEEKKISIHQSKMSSLGEMASGIAHEINNPLAIIQARAFQIRKATEQPGIDRNRIYEHVEKIDQTVDRIARIIKGLRSFSRNSDRDPMNVVSVSSIIESTMELCRARFKHHGVDLKIGSVPELHVLCRESQLAQVLLNLMNNAFDAVLELPEKWVSIEVEDKGNEIGIKVTDSGRGIPEAILEKIMYPFFTTKEVGKGTGLGLSISKGIVEEHKGRIEVDRNCVNTCFVITMPKAVAEFRTSKESAA